MANKYLRGLSSKTLTEQDAKIKSHLVRAKKEVLSALQVITDQKRKDVHFRLASRSTEVALAGVLNLLENIPFIRPIDESKQKTVKELREQRKGKGKEGTLKGKGVRNVRRR